MLATDARIKFLLDGDVAAAILAADPDSSVDLCIGTGGTPEGVITACALKCMDGQILGRMNPQSDAERAAAREQGHDLDRLLTTADLVSGEDISSPPPASPTASCCAGCATRRRGYTPSRCR